MIILITMEIIIINFFKKKINKNININNINNINNNNNK